MENKQKGENQENFTTNYDESKVIDIKAMGLVKKRNRNDLEKKPNSGEEKHEDKDKDFVNSTNEKLIKSKNGEIIKVTENDKKEV